MLSNILKKYFFNKNKEEATNIPELEILTRKIMETSSVPEYPIMQMIVELSENGVIGLDELGNIIFYNTSAVRMLGKDDLNNLTFKKIFDESFYKIIDEFIQGKNEKCMSKANVNLKDKSKVLDVVLYRVNNNKISFIAFIIDCLENVLFKQQHCPLKQNCPFHNKCETNNENPITE